MSMECVCVCVLLLEIKVPVHVCVFVFGQRKKKTHSDGEKQWMVKKRTCAAVSRKCSLPNAHHYVLLFELNSSCLWVKPNLQFYIVSKIRIRATQIIVH